MVDKKVLFSVNGIKYTGKVLDKVNVPIASGNRDYCPMDNYLIQDFYDRVHTVNPICVIKVIEPYPNVLDLREICTPFLSEESLKILDKKLPESLLHVDKESTELHATHLGLTVSLPHPANFNLIENVDITTIPENHIKKFCNMINVAVNEGLLKEGVIGDGLVGIKLALISPAVRYCLLLNGATTTPFSELKKRNDSRFVQEGELPKE